MRRDPFHHHSAAASAFDPGPSGAVPLPVSRDPARGDVEVLVARKRMADIAGEVPILTTTRPHEGIDVYVTAGAMNADTYLSARVYAITGGARVLVDHGSYPWNLGKASNAGGGEAAWVSSVRASAERFEVTIQAYDVPVNGNDDLVISAVAGPAEGAPQPLVGAHLWRPGGPGVSGTVLALPQTPYQTAVRPLGPDLRLVALELHNVAAADRWCQIYDQSPGGLPIDWMLRHSIRVPANGSKEYTFPFRASMRGSLGSFERGLRLECSTTNLVFTAGAGNELFASVYLK